ncbi:methyltransferase TYW3-domain-containing protein [Pilobolus umbonatus]|nr:methyltransferase TYW3-domain-containing protein [Pilobolus umbonatus]
MMSNNTAFNIRKQQVVSSLVEHVDPERRDKSPKGFIDEPILDLMHLINLHPAYYTTSSCSGRVAIYCEGVRKDEEEVKTSKGGRWLYVSHDPIDIPVDNRDINDGVIQLLFGDESDKVIMDKDCRYNGHLLLKRQMIYFKFEPLILHIEASSYETAMQLLTMAHQLGYQNSGITASRRHMIAIRSTLKIDVPIGYMDNDKIHSLVNTDYLLLLLRLSNEKFEQNIHRLKLFEVAMRTQINQSNEERIETKEERRERKIREGKLKQQSIDRTKDKDDSPQSEDISLMLLE